MGTCLTALLLFGCKRESTTFPFLLRESVEVGPISSVNTPIEFTTGPSETKSEIEYTVFDTRKGLIETATPIFACIVSKVPDSAIFALKRIEIYLQGEGLDPLLIVPETDVPDSILPYNSLSQYYFCVDPLPAEAKKHISKETYQTIVRFTLDKPLNYATAFWIDLEFEVKAKEFLQ